MRTRAGEMPVTAHLVGHVNARKETNKRTRQSNEMSITEPLRVKCFDSSKGLDEVVAAFHASKTGTQRMKSVRSVEMTLPRNAERLMMVVGG